MIRKNEKLLILVILPLTIVIFSAIWFIRTNYSNVVRMDSEAACWDIRGVDISEKCLRLSGNSAEFILGELLTPEEFDLRDDIQMGSPRNAAQCHTSRNKILLSSDETVALSFASVDYANNIYINGELIQSVGIPGTSVETAVPMTTRVYYTVKPVDGVIEIVNQISNFVHAEGGSFSGVYIGTIDSMSMHYARQAHGTTITLGICLLLFLVHTILFMLQRSYKANIFFAIFSLVLFVRTGVTGMKILMLVFPRMSWYFSFRVEYLSLPLGCLLIVLALAGMFKRLLPKPVIISSIIVNSIESVLIVFIPTVLMTKALPLLQFTIIVSLIFIVVRFFMLLSRERSSEYIIALCALIFVVYAIVREILMHLDILIFPMINNGMLDLAILVFTIFLLTASFLGTIREIDAAKQNEQRLEIENVALASVNSLKTELMTTVSHELRTPLAVIMGYAQLITREAAASGISNRAMTDIDSIVSETKRLTRIVDEMQRVVLARVEGPGTPVSLADVVQRVAKMYATILEGHETTLETQLTNKDTQVIGISDELTQVMFNLLSNAGKHTDNGVIRIIVERDGGQVFVTVEDTGTGIEPEFLPDVFERYSHGDEQGTGLGLAICREIIEGRGGHISIESVYGEGTKVRFSLPAYKKEED